jgi:hypothetical protein
VRTALVIAVPLGVFFTAAAWRISELLSPDAIGMALGMLFGVLAGVPTAALVLVASRSAADRRPAPDYDIDAFAEDVTPYTHTFRRVAGMPALPDRQAQIQELRSYLAYLEAEEVR